MTDADRIAELAADIKRARDELQAEPDYLDFTKGMQDALDRVRRDANLSEHQMRAVAIYGLAVSVLTLRHMQPAEYTIEEVQ